MPTVGPFPYGDNVERWGLGLPCWELPTFCPANPKTGQAAGALPFVRPRAEMGIGAALRGVASNGGISSSWQPPAAAGGWDGASRAATSPALVQLHPPLTLSFPSPVPTVRSPPGLAKTPLSALGLKPHNPAEILLHPVGGECREGAAGGFSWGTSTRTPLGRVPCLEEALLPPCFGRVALGTLSLPIGIWGCAERPPSRWWRLENVKVLALPNPSSSFLLSSLLLPAQLALQPRHPGLSATTVSRALSVPESAPCPLFLLLAGFLGAALRGGSSLGCSLGPTPSLGSGRHLWGAQVGRWRRAGPGLGRRGALLCSLRAA